MNTFTSSLCKRWNSFLLSGFLLLILGTIALTAAYWTTMATVLLFGGLLVAAGVVQILHSFWAGQWKGFFSHMVVGILSTVIGWLILTKPAIGAASITLLLAVFFITSGLFKVAGSLFLQGERWGWLFFNGLVTLIFGLLVFAQWPTSSLWIIGLFIGADLIVSGWVNILFSLKVRQICKLEGNLA